MPRYNTEQLESRIEKMRPDLLIKQSKQRKLEENKIWKQVDHKTIKLIK